MTSYAFYGQPAAEPITIDSELIIDFNYLLEFIESNNVFPVFDAAIDVLTAKLPRMELPISCEKSFNSFIKHVIKLNIESVIPIYVRVTFKLYITPTKSTAIPIALVKSPETTTPSTVLFSSMNGFDEQFLEQCRKILKVYCDTIYPSIKAKGQHSLETKDFKLFLYNPSSSTNKHPISFLTIESFYSNRLRNLLFEKTFSYSSLEFEFVKPFLTPQFTLREIVDNPNRPFQLYNLSNKDQYTPLFAHFDMKFIVRYICLYLSFFQCGLDDNNSEANRRIVLNIFVIFISSMLKRNFSIEHNIQFDPTKRMANGPLDYLFLPSYVRTSMKILLQKKEIQMQGTDIGFTASDLFTSSDEQFDWVMSKILARELAEDPIDTVADTTAVNNSANRDMIIVNSGINNNSEEDDEAAPGDGESNSSSRRTSFCNQDGMALWEGKKDNQFNEDALNKSLGQLSGQMLDYLHYSRDLDSTNARENTGNLTGNKRKASPTHVKGIISTGQTCLFFGMTGCDTDGSNLSHPVMKYYGLARLNIFPKITSRHSGIVGNTLRIVPADVELFLKQLYVFMSADFHLASSSSSSTAAATAGMV
jgi:hypothetical protein